MRGKLDGKDHADDGGEDAERVEHAGQDPAYLDQRALDNALRRACDRYPRSAHRAGRRASELIAMIPYWHRRSPIMRRFLPLLPPHLYFGTIPRNLTGIDDAIARHRRRADNR